MADGLGYEQIDAFPNKTRLAGGRVEKCPCNSSQVRKEGSEMKTVSAVFFALLLVSLAAAQQRWTRSYGGTSYDVGSSVRQTSDSGYIITGGTASYGHGFPDLDMWFIKTNASGDTIWTRTCGGTRNDDGLSVQQTSDSGYVIAGYTLSFGAGAYDIYVIKTSATGDTLWTRTYGGTRDEEGNSVQQTSDGGYIIAGYTSSFGAGSFDVYLIKTNASGDTLWTRTYGGGGDDEGNSVRQTADSGYIVAGFTSSFGAGNEDIYLVKTNASGDTLWTRTYGGSGYEEGSSVEQTADGGYIVAGYTDSFGADSADVYLVKTNSAGDTIWTRTYGGSGSDEANALGKTSDGGYIIGGWTSSFGAGSRDVYLVRTNASGDTVWTRTCGGTGIDYGSSVQQTADGGYVAAGYTTSVGTGGDVYLIKTDETGNVGVEEPGSDRSVATGSLMATPNPFSSSVRIPGHEAERFSVYDISGKMVETCRGGRVGEGLAPAVYFIKPDDGQSRSLRIVKVR